MGARNPFSKTLWPGDTVQFIAAQKPVPQWAIGKIGTVERLTREGNIVVDLGYQERQKRLVAKRHQLILIRGKNFTPTEEELKQMLAGKLKQ